MQLFPETDLSEGHPTVHTCAGEEHVGQPNPLGSPGQTLLQRPQFWSLVRSVQTPLQSIQSSVMHSQRPALQTLPPKHSFPHEPQLSALA